MDGIFTTLNEPKCSMSFYSDFGDGEVEPAILQQRQGNESPSFVGTSQFNGAQPELPNELSAPYEVPQFPIEQIEKKLAIQRQLNVKVLSDRRSHYEPSVPGDEQDHAVLDENDLYVPHFQRVSISGEDTSGVPLEDLERASRLIVQSLQIRKRYMKISHQSFSTTAGRFLDPHKKQPHHDEKQTIEGRTTWWNPNPLPVLGEDAGEGGEDADFGIAIPEPETGPGLLSHCSEDHSLGPHDGWSVKSSSDIADEFAVAIVRSNLWPGAYCFSTQGKIFQNVYFGSGLKASVPNFSPNPLPPVEQDYPIGPEILEIHDPTGAEEEQWRIAHLPKEMPVKMGLGEEEEVEGEEEEEEEDEDDD